MKTDTDTPRPCRWCGGPIDQYAVLVLLEGRNPYHHARRYCSPDCRYAAEAARKEERG